MRQLEANGTSGRRETLWGYREGRLTGVRVAPQRERPPEPEPHYAVSVVYSADVVDDQFNIVSRDPKTIGQILGHAVVKTPTNILGAHGLPKATRYNMDGKLAERIDESGMTLRYRYDPTGRLVKAAAMPIETYPMFSPIQVDQGGATRLLRTIAATQSKVTQLGVPVATSVRTVLSRRGRQGAGRIPQRAILLRWSAVGRRGRDRPGADDRSGAGERRNARRAWD